MKKITPYLITALVFLIIGGSMHMYQSFHSEDLDKPVGETLQYEKYCLDDWTFNLSDCYFSKLEMFILYLCWIVGSWNLMDAVLLLIEIKKFK